jgi:hypothetical protein
LIHKFISTLLELPRIGFDGVERRSQKFHFDVLVDDFIEQALQPVRDRIQIDRTWLEHLAAREGKQLSR